MSMAIPLRLFVYFKWWSRTNPFHVTILFSSAVLIVGVVVNEQLFNKLASTTQETESSLTEHSLCVRM